MNPAQTYCNNKEKGLTPLRYKRIRNKYKQDITHSTKHANNHSSSRTSLPILTQSDYRFWSHDWRSRRSRESRKDKGLLHKTNKPLKQTGKTCSQLRQHLNSSKTNDWAKRRSEFSKPPPTFTNKLNTYNHSKLNQFKIIMKINSNGTRDNSSKIRSRNSLTIKSHLLLNSKDYQPRKYQTNCLLIRKLLYQHWTLNGWQVEMYYVIINTLYNEWFCL